MKQANTTKDLESAFDWQLEFPEICNNDGTLAGFDVVIGNPPYISYYSNTGEKLDEITKEYFVQNYNSVKTLNERLNVMNLFVELATKITRNDGFISFILNKTFTVLPSYSNIRAFLLENTAFTFLISDVLPFDAIVDCCIIGLKNYQQSENYNFKILTADLKNERSVSIHTLKNNPQFVFKLSENQNIIEKINSIKTHLSDFVEINRGVNIGGCFDSFLSSEKKNQDYYKYLSGTKCIKPYTYQWKTQDGFMYFDETLETQLRQSGKTLVLGNKQRFLAEKLFIPESSQQLMAAFSDEIIYSAYGIMVATPKNEAIDLKVILALLNSSLLRYYVIETEILRKGGKATPHIGVKGLKSIPIPEIDISTQETIIQLVDKIIELKKAEKDSKEFENLVDLEIYKLYDIEPITNQ